MHPCMAGLKDWKIEYKTLRQGSPGIATGARKASESVFKVRGVTK